MIDVLFVDKKVILAATALMPSVMAGMNVATLCKTAPTRFLLQEHHATKTDVIQGIDTPTTEGTDHAPPIIVPNMGDISAGQSPSTIPTVTEAAVLEGTSDALLPAIVAGNTTLWLIDAPITTHSVTPPGIVTPHPILATSPTDITYPTLQTGAGLTPATPTTQQRNLSRKAKQFLRPSTPHEPNCFRTVTIQDSPSDSACREKIQGSD